MVHRVEGGIASWLGSTFMAATEYAVERFNLKALLVVADSNSEIIEEAVEQQVG